MPNYEYECKSCGHRFTQFQNMKDKPLTECPQCSGPVRRLISGGAGVIFKGSGFYATDYKNKSRNSNRGCDCGNGCSNPKRCCEK
ncbi:zinc ribbon domain-containing protein [bacterium]|nr:zinc ribbon domain-containing protein [bacterium]RQV97985.1 MAG: zinc ribbon domain-containing protein [bacterium]